MTTRSVLPLLAALGVLVTDAAAAHAQEPPEVVRASPADSGAHLVVYGGDLALVTERFTADLPGGPTEIILRDVAARLDPTSILLSTEASARLRVREQTFDPGGAGTDRLLERYAGREIRLVTRESSSHEGVLLSADDDIVLRREDGSLVALPRATIRALLFPGLPEGMSARPRLSWRLGTEDAGPTPMRLSYLTGGLDWRADYALLLDPEEERFDLQGSVTIENRSGSNFPGARLTLLAGEIQRADDDRMSMPALAEMAPAQDRRDSPVEARPFSEYHRYDIPWPVDLPDGVSTRLGFVSAAAVPVSREHVYDAASVPRHPRGEPLLDPGLGETDDSRPVLATLRFHTGEDEGVGARLPAGRVRIYREDEDGVRVLLGEDRIEHTSVEETVRLTMGAAFDIVGERVRLEHERLGDYGLEETYRITLRNHRHEAVEVTVVEHLFRWSSWTITDETLDGEAVAHRARDADTVEWDVPVPPGDERILTYTVRYTWR